MSRQSRSAETLADIKAAITDNPMTKEQLADKFSLQPRSLGVYLDAIVADGEQLFRVGMTRPTQYVILTKLPKEAFPGHDANTAKIAQSTALRIAGKTKKKVTKKKVTKKKVSKAPTKKKVTKKKVSRK